MKDFGKRMGIAAALSELGDFLCSAEDSGKGLVKTRRKDPGRIFAEAKITGQKDQIGHLCDSIIQFHRDVTEQDEKIKALEEERNSLSEKLRGAEKEANAFKEKNLTLVHKNKGLKKSIGEVGGKVSKVGKKVVARDFAINTAINLLNGVNSKAAKGDYQTCFKKVMKVLTSADGDGAGASSAGEKTEIPPGGFMGETDQPAASAT